MNSDHGNKPPIPETRNKTKKIIATIATMKNMFTNVSIPNPHKMWTAALDLHGYDSFLLLVIINAIAGMVLGYLRQKPSNIKTN